MPVELSHDEHGVAPEDMVWVRGGLEQPGRVEKNASEASAPEAGRLTKRTRRPCRLHRRTRPNP